MPENGQKCGIPSGGYDMSGWKNSFVTLGFVLSVSLIASAVSVLLVSRHYSRLSFDLINIVCGEIAEQDPDAKKVISAALKEYTGGNADGTAEEDILSALGYRISDFSGSAYGQNILYVLLGFLAGILLFCLNFYVSK